MIVVDNGSDAEWSVFLDPSDEYWGDEEIA